MPATPHLATTDIDHIPPDFTLENLSKVLDTPEEIAALTKGDDPMFTQAQVDAFYKPQGDKTAPDVVQDLADAAGAPALNADAPVEAAAPPQPAAEAPPPAPAVPDLTEARRIIDGYEAEIEALADKLDEGDITRAEFKAQQKAMADNFANAKAQIAQAQQQVQSYQQTVAQKWTQAYLDFAATQPFLQTLETADPDLWRSWDGALQAVNSNPAFSGLTYQQRLSMAYDQVQVYATHTGKTMPPRVSPQQQAKVAAEQAQRATGPRTDARPDPIQTLGGLANASPPSVHDGQFSAIDAMDADAAERAFQRMSPDQQEAYLRQIGGDWTGRE